MQTRRFTGRMTTSSSVVLPCTVTLRSIVDNPLSLPLSIADCGNPTQTTAAQLMLLPPHVTASSAIPSANQKTVSLVHFAVSFYFFFFFFEGLYF